MIGASPTSLVLNRRTMLGAAAVVGLTAGAARAAEPHRLIVGDRLPRFDWLKPGVRTYLRSRQTGAQHMPTDIWRREIRHETTEGAPRLRIVQRWDGPAAQLELDSLFERDTFRPLTHTRITTRDGVRRVEAFRFLPDRIVGLEGVADNSRADFEAAADEPTYNFETDMEMLQTLPLAAGYAASIPFYHPGAGTPRRYLWTVAGDEARTGPDGRPIDCWIVQTDYNDASRPPARFWLAKATQQLVLMEQAGPNGAIGRKTLLSVE